MMLQRPRLRAGSAALANCGVGTVPCRWDVFSESRLRESCDVARHVCPHAGLGACVMNWSAGLVSSRRQELADMVLRYTLPCEHLSRELKDAGGKGKHESADCRKGKGLPTTCASP